MSNLSKYKGLVTVSWQVAMVWVLVFCLLDRSWAQEALPVNTITVPERVETMGLQLRLDAEFQKKVKGQAEFLMKNSRFFRITVDRADAYFTIVERVLKEEGVPDDLKYLVLQESKLVSDVVSTSNAVGYWQFKDYTAREMGLRVDSLIDERKNIVASTRAAARYLKRHNQQFNNWLYSVLGYYAGASGAKTLVDMSLCGQQQMDLDTNTHPYIAKFLAHKLAYESAIHRNPQLPLEVVEYTECESKTLEEIALATQVPLEDVRFYNKWATQGVIPADKDYTVILPVKNQQAPAFLALKPAPTLETSPNLKPYEESRLFGLIKVKIEPPTPTPVAVVQKDGTVKTEYITTEPTFLSWNGIKAILAKKGDNIALLAQQGDIDKEDFMEYNDLRSFDKIIAGQVYYLKGKNRKAQVPYHVVKPSETLWEVSQQYGIAMKHLLKKNRMETAERLVPGRVLWMRHTRPEFTAIEYKPVEVKPLLPMLSQDTQQVVASIKRDVALPVASDPTPKTTQAIISTQPESADSASQGDIEEDSATVSEVIELPSVKVDSAISKVVSADNRSFQKVILTGGKTLFSLSKELQVSYDSLLKWNTGPIALGQEVRYRLVLPKAIEVPEKVQAEERKQAVPLTAQTKPQLPPHTDKLTHTVAAKETLYSIARKYKISVSDLQKWNNKSNAGLTVGEVLVVGQ